MYNNLYLMKQRWVPKNGEMLNFTSCIFTTIFKKEKKKRKVICCPLFGKLDIVNLATYPKLIYRFSAISNKTPADFFAKVN